jgi:hypothetical protein
MKKIFENSCKIFKIVNNVSMKKSFFIYTICALCISVPILAISAENEVEFLIGGIFMLLGLVCTFLYIGDFFE